MDDKQVVISASICLDIQEQNKIARAGEALSRFAAGLALEGISVNVSFGVLDNGRAV